MRNLLFLAVASLFVFSACSDDDDNSVIPKSSSFTLTIENIQSEKPYLNSGTFDQIPPGGSATFSFNALPGSYLSLATMLVESNDLFYGFEDTGIALYDANGEATTGFVNAQLYLWDAGTEVNQEPGVGVDQASRQAVANTGADENGVVQLIEDVGDGFTYPPSTKILHVVISHDGGTEFTVLLHNTSGVSELRTLVGSGVWVVHETGKPIFVEGESAANGLESLAEDKFNEEADAYLEGKSGYVSPFSPGVFVVHSDGYPLFIEDETDAGNGLEALAEDSNPTDLGAFLPGLTEVEASGIFSVPAGGSEKGPLLPGESYEFTFEASEGDSFNFASMLVHTNDLFAAFEEEGIQLFKNGQAISGDLTRYVKLWDAGTEENQYPGYGSNQSARQEEVNTGPEDQDDRIREAGYCKDVPPINELIKVTINPN